MQPQEHFPSRSVRMRYFAAYTRAVAITFFAEAKAIKLRVFC